jgi:hypothetical protein
MRPGRKQAAGWRDRIGCNGGSSISRTSARHCSATNLCAASRMPAIASPRMSGGGIEI